MQRRTATLLCVLAASCSFRPGAVANGDAGVQGDGDQGRDGDAPDASDCAFSAWNTPLPIAALNVSTSLDARPRLSPDELSVIFYSDRLGDRDIFTATRTALTQPFSTPAVLSVVNTAVSDRDPALTPDGLQLFFASDRNGTLDLFTAARASTSSNSTPQMIAGLSTTDQNDYFPSLSHDGLTIYFSANRAAGSGTHDIWHSTRASLSAEFITEPMIADVSSSTLNDYSTAISADGRELYFSQTVSGGEIDIFVATRSTTASAFETPMRVAELSFAGEDHPGWLSRDGLRFYYSNQSSGNSEIYTATRSCD